MTSLRILMPSLLAALGLVLSGMTGCAATTPKELKQARNAYKSAEEGPAAVYSPSALLEARQALMKAEGAFEEEGDDVEVRDMAYIAGRKAQIAMAIGHTKMFQEELAKAKEKQNQLAAQIHERLNETKEELKEESEQRVQAEQQVEKLRKVAKIAQEERGLVITLSSQSGVAFEVGESKIMPTAYPKLDKIAEVLSEGSERTITIEGHTDAQGPEATNKELSRERAQSVKDYLVRRGVQPHRIKTVGYGESQPLATNESPTGRALNRRVEIVLEPMELPPEGTQGTGAGIEGGQNQ